MDRLQEYCKLRDQVEKDYQSDRINDRTYADIKGRLKKEYPEYTCKSEEEFKNMKSNLYSSYDANDSDEISDRERAIELMRNDKDENVKELEAFRESVSNYDRAKESIYKEYTEGRITLSERERRLFHARQKYIR